jgi:hypothetical protein
MSDIKTYIDDIFRYLDTFESNYQQFNHDGFIQTYNGIYAVFQALRQQRDKAIEVDQYFLERIRRSPLTSSDLRQVTIQLLISYFESEADVDGQSNRAYGHCRDLRAIKRDVPFLENHLVPMLFTDGALNNNFELNRFFLREIARFMQKFGSPVDPNLSPEQFGGMPNPNKFLELERRRVELGSDLIKDRGSLEFHLKQVDTFNKLCTAGRLYERYLREWDYLVTTTFWARVKAVLGRAWGKVKGAISNWSYFRLILTQRNPAYVFYSVIMIVMIALALLVPSWWGAKNDSQLEQFKQHSDEVQNLSR